MINKIEIKNKVLKEGVHYVTSDYKTRNQGRSDHNGIDLIGNNKNADYIVAIADGQVLTSKYSSSAGYYVEIRHFNNYISRYLHMTKNSITVKKGDFVKKGDIIGYMGATGNATGVHLHFAVNDNKNDSEDPLPFLLGTNEFKSDLYKEFIINVQNSLDVEVDGIAGPKTLEKTITISSNTNNRHMLVKYIQLYLYGIGYTEIGKADGIAGAKFTKAIKHYQKNNNCVPDGIITKKNKTWKSLLGLL